MLYERNGLVRTAAALLGLVFCLSAGAQTRTGVTGAPVYQDQIEWSSRAQPGDLATPAAAPIEVSGAGGSGSDMSPRPSAGFEAIADDDTATIPNIQGAVGLGHLLAVSNTRLLVQDRSGQQLSSMTLDDFWSGLEVLDTVDPRLVYDPYSQRFILVSVAGVLGTNVEPVVLVAVSQTGDPTGSWRRFMIDVDVSTPVYGRSPTLGFNKKWVTVQFNMFDQSTDFLNSHDIFVFNKTNLYAGIGAFTRFELNDLGDVQNCPVPAVTFDNQLDSLYLMSNWLNDDEGYGFLRIFSIDGPLNAPVFNYGEFVGANQTIPAWSDIAPDDEDFAQQLGTPQRIYLNDARIQNVVFRRGTLWTTHTVFYPSENPTYSAVQWFETTPGGNIFQRGTLENPANGTSYAYPSIAVNRNNDVLLSYSVFAPFFYAHPNYAFRIDADPFSRLRGETFFRGGDGPYYRPVDGYNLWGERASTVVDPINDTEFWSIQPYAAQPEMGEGRWGTWWARVSPPANVGFLSSSDSPDPVIAGGSLTYSFSITNHDPRVVEGTQVRCALPAGVSFLTGTTSNGGDCSISNNIVTCHFGFIDQRAGATGSITVRPSQSGTLNSTLTLSHNGPDPTPANNSVTLSTTVSPSADMAVLVTDSPDPARLNQDLTYNIVATNLGPSSATAVFVTNIIAASVTFVSATPSQGTCSRTGTRVICNLGSVAALNSVAIAVVVRSPATGLVTNRTDIRSAAPDPNSANNSVIVDTRVASPPTLTAIANQVINEDTAFGPLSFTVGDAETPAAQLMVGATSSNPALLPESSLILGGTGSARTLRGTPALNQFGITTISVRVTDLDGLSVTNSFTLTVNPVNDPPTISSIPPLTIDEDTQAGPFTVTVGDVETPAENLVLTAVSSNPTLLPVNRIQVTGTGANRTVILSSATNQFGVTVVTLRVSDGEATTDSVFTLTVLSVNDPPTLSVIPDQTINEDQATAPLALLVGDLESPVDSLILAAEASDPEVLPSSGIEFGGTGANRTILCRPATNAFGVITVRVRVTDPEGASTTNSFLLTINPINDPPTMDPIPNLTIDEDAGEQVITLTGVSPGPRESDSLTFLVLSDNMALIPPPTVTHIPGEDTATLRFTSATNASGTAVIRVIMRDSQPTNNSALRLFSVTVLPVNDPPYISPVPDQVIAEDTSTGPLPFTIWDVETPAEELIVFIASSNTTVVPNQAVILVGSGSNWTVRVTPSPNAHGQSEIALIATDGETFGYRTFLVTVTPVNDPPTVVFLQSSVTIPEDTLSAPVQFLVQDPDTPIQNLVPTVESGDPTLIPNDQIMLSGSGVLRTLRAMPAPNRHGSTTITLRLDDGEAPPAVAILAVTVTPVNDLPTLDFIPDLAIDEDGPMQVLTLTGITTGAPDEVQALAVSAFSDDPSLTGPLTVHYQSPAATGTLAFQTPPNAMGTTVVHVVVQESGPAPNRFERQFSLRVRNLNDPPTITPIENITLNEDHQSQPLAFRVGDPETPPDRLTITPFSSNEELVPLANIILAGLGEQRFVIVRPALNQFGFASIALTVRDEDGASDFAFFDVTVISINDMPVVSTIPNLSLNSERPSETVPFTISDDETLPDSLVLSWSASNTNLLPAGSVEITGQGSQRAITVVPSPGMSGTAMVTLSVTDLEGGRSDRSFGVSYFDGPILRIGQVETNAVLSWSTNFPHHVPAYNSVMSPSEWTALSQQRTMESGRFRMTVPIQPQQGFFQLVELPPPTITALADLSVLEDSSTPPLSFTVSGITNETGELLVEGTAENEELLPASGIVFTGSGSERMVILTPAADRFGVTRVTVAVIDGVGRRVTSDFTLTVTGVNDPPSFVAGPDQTVLEDSGPRSIPGWAGALSVGPHESGQLVSFLVTSDNPGLFSAGPLVSADGTLHFTPAPDANGTAIVQVQARDDGGVENGGVDTGAQQMFRVTVTPVNDPPTFVVGPDQTVLEDSGAQTVVGWTALFRSGPPNESGQVLSVEVEVTDPGLFSVAPSVAVNGTLTYTPAPDAFGSALVTVRVVDDGGTSDGGQDIALGEFTVTVEPVNDSPTLDPIADVTIDEDAGVQVLELSGLSSGAANETDTLSYSVITDNPELVLDLAVETPAEGPPTVSFSVSADAHGTAMITLTVDDNQPTNNIVARVFMLTVNPVNDAPTLDPIEDIVLMSLTGEIDVDLTGIASGADNESQTLLITAVSDNTALLPDPQVVYTSPDGTGRLVLQPMDVPGNARVTVTVRDDGGTAFGGVDTVIREFTVYYQLEIELRIELAGANSIRLSWPTTPPGFTLESRAAMSEGAIWTTVMESPMIVGEEHVLILPIEGVRFFRLAR